MLDVVHCDKLNDKFNADACYTGSTGSTGLLNNYYMLLHVTRAPTAFQQNSSTLHTMFVITLAILDGFRSNFDQLLLLDVVRSFLNSYQLARA